MYHGGVILKKRIHKNTVIMKHFAIYKAAIHLVFNTIADINKWTRKEATMAIDEYFRLIHDLKKKNTNEKIGGVSTIFYKFAEWIHTGTSIGVATLIGKFDTPCNTILSLLSIGVWSMVIYNTINNVSPDDAKHSLAQPAQYIIYNISPEIYNLEENINNTIVQYITNTITINRTIIEPKQIVSYVRTLFYEPILYKKLFETPIVCMLKYNIESCNEKCKIYSKPKSHKKSKSNKKSKSDKKSKSSYYTPKE
jgi:hypothetical protein